MPPKSKKRGRGRSKSEDVSDIEEEAPPPPPPRPFKEVEGLPLSIEEPSYSILNNALSLKDSAVLYTSLMRSRKAYTNGNIFDLYWAKGKTKFDNDVNARDRMNKFCECVINIGPHNYDTRFFILKNDEIEKKRQDEKDKKKEKRLAAKKEREEKQKQREIKKAKQEALDSSLSDPTQPPPPGAPVSQSAPSSAPPSQNVDNEAGTPSVRDEDENKEDQSEEEEEEDDENESTSVQSRDTSFQPESTPQAEPQCEKAEEVPNKVETKVETKQPEISTPNPKLEQAEEPNKLDVKPSHPKPLPPLQVPNQNKAQNVSSISQSQSQPPAPVPSQTQQSNQNTIPQPQPQPSVTPIKPVQQPLPRAPQPPPPNPPPSAQAQNDIMQTPESQMMIANLNAIARKEPSLNALMKVVATGNAKPEEIREFQGYIQRAKAMGPTAYYHQAFPNNQYQQQQQQQQQQQSLPPPPPKPPKKVKPPKQPKPPKEKQLTTFQEMYVDGADLVFEFSENPNIRYHLPKDSIIEKLPNGELLISTLIIHNRDQIKKWDQRQKNKKEKKEKEEKENKEKEGSHDNEDKSKNEDETKKDENETKSKPTTPLKQRRTRKTAEKEAEEKEAQDLIDAENLKKAEEEERIQKAKKAEEERKLKELEEADKRPIPYFSAISFTLSQIEDRYLQIFHNSFNKLDTVKPYMEDVLKNGIRVPKHYLWYSVDAYEDESLAENLREWLYLLENPIKGKAANRKRANDDTTGTPQGKRVKKEI
ncbi:SWR1-complex protein [Wickerhamomyces ciferrii]|uniref:SWR1-complex protein n=1 Tax=Wickerhamomyces ciferrii (strain ATCC 14091 / BCRC 22168 / CBS 111 / JCM 3599 / NBRC 0793 / NRRL Y-1031 F-60-10) TaxID=1206466 RepID=K0KGG9_WICCF|nr:SWR1-complex protein [Wickerhamomyces ciferrii]CCH40539.1 SWR1-complex protein [Wickerhamomyces ciferrii]